METENLNSSDTLKTISTIDTNISYISPLDNTLVTLSDNKRQIRKVSFDSSINITEDYKNYLDTKYKREITHPLTRSEYQQYINKIHKEFIDTYVQPLWENTLKSNSNKVNEIKQNM